MCMISLSFFHVGGGFGGKETRSTFLSSAVAVAAHKLVPQNSMYRISRNIGRTNLAVEFQIAITNMLARFRFGTGSPYV